MKSLPPIITILYNLDTTKSKIYYPSNFYFSHEIIWIFRFHSEKLKGSFPRLLRETWRLLSFAKISPWVLPIETFMAFRPRRLNSWTLIGLIICIEVWACQIDNYNLRAKTTKSHQFWLLLHIIQAQRARQTKQLYLHSQVFKNLRLLKCRFSYS